MNLLVVSTANSFCAFHRSAIVNLDHISQIEEFDRRLLLYMSDGSEVQDSRAGFAHSEKIRRLNDFISA